MSYLSKFLASKMSICSSSCQPIRIKVEKIQAGCCFSEHMASEAVEVEESPQRYTQADSPGRRSEKPSPAKPLKKPSSKEVPKAKAKASSKGESKKKASAKSKSVMKTIKKKPAAARHEVETKPKSSKGNKGLMKKPAAAPGKSGAAGIGSSSSWKEGIVRETSNATDQDAEQPEEEHGNFEEDPVLEDGEVHEIRDRTKNQKFQTMLANGELPPFIQKEWERVSKLRSGKRERQTAIINAIYDRSAAGRLISNTDKAIFESMRYDYQDTKSKKQLKTLPLLLFCGKFRLTPEQVQQGLREGQFMEVETPNGTEYGWRQSTFSEIKGVKTATGYKMSEEGDQDTMQKYTEMTQCWKSGIKRPQSIASGSNQLAICDVESPLSQEEWVVAQKQLQSAFAALDQQEKNAMRHMGVIEQNEDEPLYPLLNLVCIDGQLLFFIAFADFVSLRVITFLVQVILPGKQPSKRFDGSRRRSLMCSPSRSCPPG